MFDPWSRNRSGSYWYNQYVVVRKDLPVVHQGVQAAHAALVCESLHGRSIYSPTESRNLIILEVPNKTALRLARRWARLQNGTVESFYERDVLIEGTKPFGFTAFSYIANMFESSLLSRTPQPVRGNPLSFLKLWTPV
jgi:hypothetical protein